MAVATDRTAPNETSACKTAVRFLQRFAGRFWVLLTVLWLAQACVMPPADENAPENLPPVLVWEETEPNADWVVFDRPTDSELLFSVGNAVEDPEGDRIYYVWYWTTPSGSPTPEVSWNDTMTLKPCDDWGPLRTAKTITVTVALSDEYIWFDANKDPEFPVGYETRPPLVRMWTVELSGVCVATED